MDKIDYKQVYRECYRATAQPTRVHVAPMNFLMLDGRGDPQTTPRFQQAIETLFSLAYTLKFMLKKGPMALDFSVMPLEGLWWADDMTHFAEDRSAWQWTLMIMQPPVIDGTMVDTARAELVKKKKATSLLPEVRFERFDEGKAVQILHVGPFADEGPTIVRLHEYAHAQELPLAGRHHEIYLSDVRKTAPEKLKTILRQPIRTER